MASITILFADDNELIRKLICPYLRAQGYKVLEAADGAEAIAVVSRYPYPIDLLISDVVMPGLDGPALACRLTHDHPGMRVIFISGYPDCDLGPEVAFLPKPFPPKLLARKVAEVLSGPTREAGSEGSVAHHSLSATA